MNNKCDILNELRAISGDDYVTYTVTSNGYVIEYMNDTPVRRLSEVDIDGMIVNLLQYCIQRGIDEEKLARFISDNFAEHIKIATANERDRRRMWQRAFEAIML